jgi:hypothetical protein
MRWIDEITLIGQEPPAAEEDATNENGFAVPLAEAGRTTIFGNKKSVGYAEFYQAQQAGIAAELKFDVYTEEYAGQRLAEHAGRLYRVIRTYQSKSGETIELTLSDLSERGGADDGNVEG